MPVETDTSPIVKLGPRQYTASGFAYQLNCSTCGPQLSGYNIVGAAFQWTRSAREVVLAVAER